MGVVLFLCFAIYVPSLQNGFAWDDKQAAKAVGSRGRNPNVAELHPISYYFTTGYWPNKDPGSPNYRPFTVLSFGLSHALFGERADVAHLLTVLAHLLAVWLAYLVLRSLGAEWVAATLGALVFGVHALHSEAVASVVGRAESLAFVCGAVALLAARSARDRGRIQQLGRLAVAALAMFASCSFKESGIAWAAFVPLSLWLCPARSCVVGQTSIRSSRFGLDRLGIGVLVLAMLVPAVAFIWLRQSFLAGIPATGMGYLENPHLFTSTGTRVLSSLVVWGYALAVTLLPFRLGVDHGPCQFPIVAGIDDPWAWLAVMVAVAFGALLCLAFRWRTAQPLLAMSVACFFGFSVLVSNLAFPIYVVFAERTYYTPSFGLSLAVCALVGWLRSRSGAQPHPAWTLALGLWVGFSACKAWERNVVWSDDITLAEREVLDHPRSLRILVVAGAIHQQRREYVLAQARFTQAVRLDPGEPRAWIGLAKALFQTDQRAAAANAVTHAISLPAFRFRPSMRQGLLILAAKIHTLAGDLEAVCEALEESVGSDAGYLAAATDLSRALAVAAKNEQVDQNLRARLQTILRAVEPAVPPR